jgi:hypothetical protein
MQGQLGFIKDGVAIEKTVQLLVDNAEVVDYSDLVVENKEQSECTGETKEQAEDTEEKKEDTKEQAEE